MHTGFTRWLMATVAVAASAAIFVDEAVARRQPQPSVIARIHGRKFKSRGTRPTQAVLGSFAYDPNLSLFTFGASKVGRLRPGALVRAVGVVCLIREYDPASALFPMTLGCAANYRETRLGRPDQDKEWNTSTGIAVTLEAFDGTRARGTWSGTIETPGSINPTDAPVTVTNGRFNVVMSVGNRSAVAEADAGR